jgi:hypothetical protein
MRESGIREAQKDANVANREGAIEGKQNPCPVRAVAKLLRFRPEDAVERTSFQTSLFE